jgi:hypothetical protein
MAIAVGRWEETWELLSALAIAHPGAAAWVVGEAVPLSDSYARAHPSEATLPLDHVIGDRIQEVLQVWNMALPRMSEIQRLWLGIGQEGTRFLVRVRNGITYLELRQTGNDAAPIEDQPEIPVQERRDLIWLRSHAVSAHPACLGVSLWTY